MLLQISLYGIIVLYGLIIGSFLNVCIFRIPKGESIVTVGSHCISCGKPIRWYDLFPVFSFLFLKGKCRSCQSMLSWQYPAVEMTNGLLYLIVFLVNGVTWQSLLYCFLASALLVLSVIDYRTLEIPIGINIFILIIGVVLTLLDWENYLSHIVGFFSASMFLLFCFLLTRGRGIGGGDIKLMAAAGLCIGGGNIVFGLITGCIVGSVVQILKMIFTGEGRKFAFGPYLSIGIFLAMLWGNAFFDWYIGLVMN